MATPIRPNHGPSAIAMAIPIPHSTAPRQATGRSFPRARAAMLNGWTDIGSHSPTARIVTINHTHDRYSCLTQSEMNEQEATVSTTTENRASDEQVHQDLRTR